MRQILLLVVVLASSVSYAKLPRGYKTKLASVKQDVLFSQVKRNPYYTSTILSHENPGVISMLKLFSTSYLAKSFTRESDEFAEDKTKLLHTYGGVAKVVFNITEKSKFTGVLSSGSLGIMRFSLTKLGGSFTPGIALKILIDGQKSQQIFAMHSLDGQGQNYNFFHHDFESKINEPKDSFIKTLAARFKVALLELGSERPDPTFQSARQLSEVLRNGQAVNKPVSPFSIVFKPTQEVQMSTKKGHLLVRLSKRKYKKGMIIYHVFARDVEGGGLVKLGNVELDSRIIASEYGDKKLYFQHNID